MGFYNVIILYLFSNFVLVMEKLGEKKKRQKS